MMWMPDALDDERQTSLKLFVVLSKVYKTIMDKAAKDIREYGMSLSEFAVLEVLYTKGRIPLQQIGDKILITSGSITYNIDKLERKGLLKRVPGQEDRRVIFAELTDAGNELFDHIFPRHADNLHSKMSGLSTEEKQQVIDMLKVLGKGAKGD
jgi:MarR family 2-MHQ and catechol resistance regulon transcriptional repressor